jgi:hypothetical protein
MVTSLRGELQECGAAVVVIDHDELLEASMLRSARLRPPVLLRHRAMAAAAAHDRQPPRRRAGVKRLKDASPGFGPC